MDLGDPPLSDNAEDCPEPVAQKPTLPGPSSSAPVPDVRPAMLHPTPSEDADELLQTDVDANREVALIASAVRQHLDGTIRAAIKEQMQESTVLIRSASSQLASAVTKFLELNRTERDMGLEEGSEASSSRSPSDLSSESDDASYVSQDRLSQGKHSQGKQSQGRHSQGKQSQGKQSQAKHSQGKPRAKNKKRSDRSPSQGRSSWGRSLSSGSLAGVLPGTLSINAQKLGQKSMERSENDCKISDSQAGSVSDSLKNWGMRGTSSASCSDGGKKERMSFRSLEDKLKKDLFQTASLSALPQMTKTNKVLPMVLDSQKASRADNKETSRGALAEPDGNQMSQAKRHEAKAKLQKEKSAQADDSLVGMDEDNGEMLKVEFQEPEESANNEAAGHIYANGQSEKANPESAKVENRNSSGDGDDGDDEDESKGHLSSKSNSVRNIRSKRTLSGLRLRRQNELTGAIAEEAQEKYKRISASPATETVETGQDNPDESGIICDFFGSLFVHVLSCLAGVRDVSQRSTVSFFFQVSVVLVGVFSVVASRIAWSPRDSDVFDDNRPGFPPLLLDMALAAGAVFGLLACGCLRINQGLISCDEMLLAYSEQKHFVDGLKRRQRWDAFAVVACWCVAVAERLRSVLFCTPLELQLAPESFIPVVTFAISSGLLVALLFLFLRICLMLHMMIDDFSSEVVYTADFHGASEEWNVLQALLRSSCSSLQYLFLVLQSTIVAAVTVGAFDFYNHPEHQRAFVAPTILLLGVAQLFLRASTVTDHCERLPSFVNSLSVGETCERDRMYLVEYIFYSKAGFYIFEIRLTSGIVLKAFYVLFMGLFALATRIITEEQKGSA